MKTLCSFCLAAAWASAASSEVAPLTVESGMGYSSWPMIQAVGDRLVCAYSRGTSHNIVQGVRDAFARWSADGGRTWSRPVAVAASPDYGETPIGKGLDESGAALFWVRAYGGKKPHHELYRTTDGERFELLSTPELSPLPVQITDIFHVPGRGLVALWFAGEYGDAADKSWGEVVSADGGRTWTQRTIEKGLPKTEWPTEPSVARLPDGRLLCIARSETLEGEGARQWQMESTDGGLTWTRRATNIRDVFASTPSLLFDAGSGLVYNYYYERGKGALKRRVAKPDDVFGSPLAWPAPEVVARGSDAAWHAGNANATSLGKTHYVAFYSGEGNDTSVVVAPVPLAADVALVDDGAAKCRVAVAEDAHPALRFGAREIAKYLGVATGAKVEVNGGAGLLPVTVRLAMGAEAEALKEDGFTIDATPRGVEIVGANPRGALYGCYDILKKYAGMRWVFPGDDGEYCVLKGKTVRVPLGRRTVNPYLQLRKTDGDGEAAWLWHVRNNMFCETGSRRFTDRKTGKPSALSARLEELCVKGCATHGNSHIMNSMMMGWGSKKEREARMEALYAEHPEYFPLVGGKRVKTCGGGGGGDPNPCVSNPGLLDLMAENLYRHISVPHGAEYCITIGNNDTPIWCECEKCRAIDAPELAGTKGQRADRYWYAVTEIAKRVWARDPSLNLGGWAYQDFWYPPAKVKIDPRLSVRISFNNQCYRHSVDDPSCSVNAEWRGIYTAWRKTGLPLVVNRDEIGCSGSVGSSYAPSEGVLRKNFLAYPKYGCAGSHFCVYVPFQYKHIYTSAPYFGKADWWHGMWQTCYMSARMMWNPAEVDFDAELAEACRLFYGEAAWKAGMKEFRALLTKAWLETPGCYGWGLGSPLGRCLDKAGVQERLVELMGKAVAAAEASGDERAAAHMRREKDVFELTWLAARRKYLESFKELNVYRKTGEIKIDGVLDEPDWKNADALGDFRPGGHTKRDVKVVQSSVRVVYEQDNLYVSVECLLPDAKEMIAGKGPMPNDSEAKWKELGEHVELFYNYPDMFEKYYHVCVNPHGLVISAKHANRASRDESFRTQAKIATKVLDDRWVLEMAIPTSEIGMKCFDGATWKLNVGRSRYAKSLPRPETSSCCNGAFHGAANFVNIKFVPTRGRGLYQNRPVSSWSNAGFEDTIPNAKVSKYYRWKEFTFPEGAEAVVPRNWYGGNLRGEYLEEGGNHFVRLLPGRDSYLSQYYVSDAPGKVRISFRIRGRGKVALWNALYTNNDPGKSGYRQQPKSDRYEVFAAGPEWKTFSVVRDKRGLPTERLAVRFTPQKDSAIDLDDVFVSPME